MEMLLAKMPIAGAGPLVSIFLAGKVPMGCEERSLQLSERMEKATGVPLGATSLLRFEGLFTRRGDIASSGAKYCPVCVTECSNISHGRLLWELDAVTACPKHGVRLRSEKVCGAPPNEKLRLQERPFLSCVCSQCGSIGFRCINEQPEAATDYEVWTASEVGRLLELPRDALLGANAETVKEGILDATRQVFNGSREKASAAAELPKSSISNWTRGRRPPSIALILRFCYAAGASLPALVAGRFARAPTERRICSGQQVVSKRRYRRMKTDPKEIQEAIVLATLELNPPSVSALARRFGVCNTWLNRTWPEETQRLVVARNHVMQAEYQRLYQAALETYTAAAEALVSKGRIVGRKNLLRESGLPTFNNSTGRNRALLEVIARFQAEAFDVSADA